MRKLAAITMVCLMTASVLAAGENTKLTGYLLDNMCAARTAKDADAATKVQGHPKACALMPECAKSGYSLFVDGKLYKLDEQGNKLAAEALKKSQKNKGVSVTVEGTVEGDMIKVSSLTEAE